MKSKIVRMGCQSHAEVAQALNTLHEKYNYSWPEIAELEIINPPHEKPIPVSTLAKIAKTEIVPKKWRFKFPGIGAVDQRQRISIDKIDMHKAMNTIINNLEPEKAQELTKRLMDFYGLPR